MTTRRYAEKTKVPAEKSQVELRTLLQKRFAAEQIMTYWDAGQIALAFQARGRRFKIAVPMPNDSAQAERVAWRQLILIVKAQITAIDAGIMTMENALLAYTMLPDGSTLGEWAETAVPRAYAENAMPALMPGARHD